MFTADGLIGLDLADGHLLWRTPLKTASARHATTPVVVDDIVVAGSYQIGMVGVKISRDGANWQSTETWAAKDSAMNFASPVAVGGYVYELGPTKNFCLRGSQDGQANVVEGGLYRGRATE